MRFLGMLSTVLVLIAVVVATALITARMGITVGEFFVVVWPVALGVAALCGLILLFAIGSGRLLSRLDAALRSEETAPSEERENDIDPSAPSS